jgi:hypothetical protein
MATTTVSGGALSITLQAVDRITAPLERINATTLRVQKSVGRLGGNLAQATGMRALAAGASNVARSMAQIIPPLGALTAAGSVAGIIHLATRWSSFATQLTNTAYRVQVTAASLGALQGAARLAGASAEDMSAGMKGLGDALSDAVGGRDSNALQYFNMLGISMRDAKGHARSAVEALPEVADGIARIGDPRLQARVLSAMRLPAALLPFLKQGSAGLRQWEADAKRFGMVTEQGAEAAKKFELAQTHLQMAGEGLVNTIAQRLAPVMSPLLERMANWIAANREIIGQKVEEVVSKIAGAIERFVTSGGLERLGDGIRGFCEGIQAAVEWMGGWERAAIALGVVLTANMLAPLIGIGAAVGRIVAVKPAAWLLRLLGVGGTGIAIAGIMGVHRLGQMRAERGTDTPEAQAERRGNMGGRGAAGGFYDRPAVDTPGPDSNRLVSGLSALLRARLTPGGTRSFRDENPGDRQREAFDFFRSKNWSAAQSAGLVANLRHESGASLDHQARGDGGRAYGVAQWHSDRQQAFRIWASKPIQEASFQEQLGFVHHELTDGRERAAGDALRSARTPGEAASVVSRQYERPANREGEAAARAQTATAMLPRLATPVAPAVAALPAPASVSPPGLPAAGDTPRVTPPASLGPGAPPAAPVAAMPPIGTPSPAAPATPAVPAAAVAPAQRVDVRVQLVGAPPGTVVTTRTQGSVRVERPMMGGL